MGDVKNPWIRRSTRVVYQNPWIKVREDQVIRPDGKDGIYGVIETNVATGVVALTEDRQIYLVGQWRYALERYSWEIIEGGAEPEEPPMKAAQRELREEAGLVAQRWAPLGAEVHLSNSFSDEVARIFLATELSEVPAAPEGTEVLEVKKLPADEVFGMLDRGEITDAMSVIALHRLRALFQAEEKL